jgi:hypothetical protein
MENDMESGVFPTWKMQLEETACLSFVVTLQIVHRICLHRIISAS